MKKLIWIFGQPGSGRKTLIKNIYDNTENIRKKLNIENAKISYIDTSFNRDWLSYSYAEAATRIDTIFSHINDLINSDIDVLIINGSTVDYNQTHNSASKLVMTYPNLEKEIILLLPSDKYIGYERVKASDWFQSDYEEKLTKYPKEWYDVATKHMKKELQSLEELGYKYTEIDTTKGYIFKEEHSKTK